MGVAETRLTAETFEELAMPLFDQLYNFAHWLAQDRTEAEDLVQETYVKALKGFSSFRPGTNFRAWMYRILRNTFLTSRTGLKASATVALDADDGPELSAGPETPETIFIEHSQHRFLQAALVRSGGNVLPGNWGSAFYSNWNRDVAAFARAESPS
jgi:RNA polymerase sigma-70 factor (ECF subfamily)